MLVWGMCSCGESMGGTHDSGGVPRADDVLEMSVLHGVRVVGGVCVWLGAGVGEWVRGLSLGFTNPVGTGGVWDMCLGCGVVLGMLVG